MRTQYDVAMHFSPNKPIYDAGLSELGLSVPDNGWALSKQSTVLTVICHDNGSHKYKAWPLSASEGRCSSSRYGLWGEGEGHFKPFVESENSRWGVPTYHQLRSSLKEHQLWLLTSSIPAYWHATPILIAFKVFCIRNYQVNPKTKSLAFLKTLWL